MTKLPNEDPRNGHVGTADDVIVLPLQCGTQWDSLAHITVNGKMYNNRDAALVTSEGAQANSIFAIRDRIAGRGILLDVARHRGVQSLSAGEAIEASELSQIASAENVEVGPGDVLLIRTGYLSYCRDRNWESYADSAPGLGMSVLRWLYRRDVAVVATDTYAVEVKPYQASTHAAPFHVVALVYMGVLLGEIFDLDRLAEVCLRNGVYEFMFVGSPLPVTGAVGSPANPYAIL